MPAGPASAVIVSAAFIILVILRTFFMRKTRLMAESEVKLMKKRTTIADALSNAVQDTAWSVGASGVAALLLEMAFINDGPRHQFSNRVE